MISSTLLAMLFLSQDQMLQPAMWGKEVEDFQLSAVAQRDTFRLGEPIEIKTYIRNNGQAIELFKKKTRRIAEYRLIRAERSLHIKRTPLSENSQVLRDREGRPILTKDGKELTIDLTLGVSSSFMQQGRIKLIEEIDASKDFDIVEPGLYILKTTWEVPLRDKPDKKVRIEANEVTFRIVRI